MKILCLINEIDKDLYLIGIDEVRPIYQPHCWSRIENNYIGPYTTILSDTGERIKAGAKQMKHGEFNDIDDYFSAMFNKSASIGYPIDRNLPKSSLWGIADNCVSMANGNVYEIRRSGDAASAHLFPIRVPDKDIIRIRSRDRSLETT